MRVLSGFALWISVMVAVVVSKADVGSTGSGIREEQTRNKVKRSSTEEYEKLVRELSIIEKQMDDLSQINTLSQSQKQIPIEQRYFKEGSSIYLETVLPESIGASADGLKFMKSTPHKVRKSDKMSADLMAAWTRDTIAILDMSGELICEYNAVNHSIDKLAEAFEGGQRSSNAFFTLDATEMAITEISILGKKVDGRHD